MKLTTRPPVAPKLGMSGAINTHPHAPSCGAHCSVLWRLCAILYQNCAVFYASLVTPNSSVSMWVAPQMAVCCQNLPLGALSNRSAHSVLVGALFKKFGLFLNTPRICLVQDGRYASLLGDLVPKHLEYEAGMVITCREFRSFMPIDILRYWNRLKSKTTVE
jgi:hypothetical protein